MYTDLASSYIDSWNQMEREFLNYFYNIRRIVSMIKLTNSKQWKEELVINFKNQLSEASAIEICIQGLN